MVIGFLESPYEKDCYLGVSLESQTTNPNQQLTINRQQPYKNTGKATKGKVQDIGEVNKVMPLPLPSSDRVRG